MDFIKIENDVLHIVGTNLFSRPSENVEICLKVNGDYIPATMQNRSHNVQFFNEIIKAEWGFTAKIPISEHIKKFVIEIHCQPSKDKAFMCYLEMGKFFPINTRIRHSYYYRNGKKLTTDGRALYLDRCSWFGHIKAELKFMLELWKAQTFGSKNAILFRAAFYFFQLFLRKKIWIICDRPNRADDNGEAFFRYLRTKSEPKICPIFVINKNSTDYNRIKKLGITISPDSLCYKLVYLLSDKIIIAYYVSKFLNPFKDMTVSHYYYRDLCAKRETIFLGHGIINSDLTSFFKKCITNFNLFITTTVAERKSILELPYGYTDKEVILSGLPRYDLLYDDSKNVITIMPTWRKYLIEMSTDLISSLLDGFDKTTYFRFYSDLLNNPTLLNMVKEYGYKLCFVPHPVIAPHSNIFNLPDSVTMLSGDNLSYRKVFAESSLLITDYSSVAFDFVYLRKPLLYCHFDYVEFREKHHQDGYFDYSRDGFGEVETNLEDTVCRIVEYMKNGCKLKDKYRLRIDNTFPFNDKNNCERVYSAIKAL